MYVYFFGGAGITCCIPEIDLATLDSGNDTTIEFEDSVTVTCDDGYQLDIAEMTCTADGTLDQIPTCEGDITISFVKSAQIIGNDWSCLKMYMKSMFYAFLCCLMHKQA